MAGARKHMCPVGRILVTLVPGHWSVVMIQIYLQTAPWKPQILTGGGKFGRRLMSQSRQFKGMREPIGRSGSQEEGRIGWRDQLGS